MKKCIILLLAVCLIGCTGCGNSTENSTEITQTETEPSEDTVAENEELSSQDYLWKSHSDFLDCFVKYGYDYGVEGIFDSQRENMEYEYTFNDVRELISINDKEIIDCVFIANEESVVSNEDAQEKIVKPAIPLYCALNHTEDKNDIDRFIKGFTVVEKNTYKQIIEDIVYEYVWGAQSSYFMVATISNEDIVDETARYIREVSTSDTNNGMDLLSEEDKSRIQFALDYTRFPTSSQSSFVSMQDAIDETFRDYSISATLTDSNVSMGYYQYKVTVTGDYYRDTSLKRNGETTEGSINYLIMYMTDDLSSCSPEVDDMFGDVYCSMTRIIFGN